MCGLCFSKDNLADVFTKPLLVPLFLLQRCKLLVDSSPPRLRVDVEDGDSKSIQGRSRTKMIEFRGKINISIATEWNASFH